MTKNTKTQKTEMLQMSVFVKNRKRKRYANICVLCHNFCTNYDLDLLSTSKLPSEPQFCVKDENIFGKKWPDMIVKRPFMRYFFYP